MGRGCGGGNGVEGKGALASKEEKGEAHTTWRRTKTQLRGQVTQVLIEKGQRTTRNWKNIEGKSH